MHNFAQYKLFYQIVSLFFLTGFSLCFCFFVRFLTVYSFYYFSYLSVPFFIFSFPFFFFQFFFSRGFLQFFLFLFRFIYRVLRFFFKVNVFYSFFLTKPWKWPVILVPATQEA